MVLKEPLAIPVEADCICPDVFADKTCPEIEGLPLHHGNRERKLGELFRVDGERSVYIRIEGDVSRVKRIGYGMTKGRVVIKGNAGMHLGAAMSDGEIVVEGNASDWLGVEMKGGVIRIKGDAGNSVGGAYRGSKSGMKQGVIIIEGNAGTEVGERMRKGTIAIMGGAGDSLGVGMLGGTIIVFGRTGIRPGAQMRRGTIVIFQEGHGTEAPPQLLPTFRYDCTYHPVFLRPYLMTLQRHGLEIREEYITGSYRRYNGDITELGKGEILLYDPGV
ncbi:MAG: formylmethanofuran dehydrogenase subunit C [Chloroflexi bacterium]|nr:formylmethanofuran dehydrogenase subunit C [Chloroflexota bacterium]